METYDDKKYHSTREFCHVAKEIADGLDENAKRWLIEFIHRAWRLQLSCLYKKILKKGNTYSVSVHKVDSISSNIFDVGKSFEGALKYAQKMYDRYGNDVEDVTIKREDDTQEMEPFMEPEAPFAGKLDI